MPKKTTRRAKKPKVKLAKNKVAMLCGIICGLCVLAVGTSVLLNQSEKQSTQKQESKPVTVATTQPVNPVKKETPPKKIEPQKKTETQKIEVAAKKAEPKKPETHKTETKKTESKKPESHKIETKKQEVKKESSTKKNVPVTTNAPKIQSQPQKTVPQSAPKAQSKTDNHIAAVTPPKQQEQIQQNAEQAVKRNRFDIPPASNGATIVIVIDDAGRSVENTKRYANLPFPITIAVLPKLAQSRACADAIRSAGKEVILHQPMQSLNHNLDPGPGKITSEMTTYQIAQIIKQNLQELGPGVRGMNNHEGSDVTSNEIKIGAVLEVCAEMGVYFLDSRTTANTKAPQAALERDMHIFEKAGPYLDNDIDRAKMLERMRETLAYANRHGRAIVIGHVDKSVKILPDLLAEMYPEMKAAGYKFATPSMLR